MDVLLTEEEQMVASSAREFLNGESSTALVRKMELDPIGYPPALWAKCAEMGWPGMCLPEEYGGQALPLAYLGLVLQEVGRAVAPVPLHSTAVTAITLGWFPPDWAPSRRGHPKPQTLPAIAVLICTGLNA